MKKAAVPSVLVVVVLLALGVIAETQQPKKVPRIGYLSAQDPARESARFEAIRLALRELGFIVGHAFSQTSLGKRGSPCWRTAGFGSLGP